MSPEEKIEAAEKLIAEAKAEFAAKKRNWPEKIEPGMCFGLRGFVYIYTDFGDLVIVRSSEGAQNEGKRYAPAKGFAGLEDDFTYLGHARDLIKIADDVPEPTGADLVGKLCEYCDIDGEWDHYWDTGVCKNFAPGADRPYLRDQGGQFRFARLAR